MKVNELREYLGENFMVLCNSAENAGLNTRELSGNRVAFGSIVVDFDLNKYCLLPFLGVYVVLLPAK